MKLISGKDLFESYGKLYMAMDQLQFLAERLMYPPENRSREWGRPEIRPEQSTKEQG